MDVDHRAALAVRQRRQLVHPLPIIGIVIGIFLDPFPTRRDQALLDVADSRSRHQYVEVADKAPLSRTQPSRDISGPLHQHDRPVEIGKRQRRTISFP